MERDEIRVVLPGEAQQNHTNFSFSFNPLNR